MLRDHGHTAKYTSAVVGTNGRMHELVAATLNIKLPHLQEWTDRRRTVARTYDELLGGHPLIEIPQEADWAEAVYHLYVVLVPDRDRVMAAIEAAGIGVGLHDPIPIHLQQAYAHLGHEPGSFPVAERSATSLLSLPMFAEMTGDQIEYVATTLRDAVEGST
jgi:dTDP-4-amino-4,6-dideoxygalactose transaminase